ncbi:MULTISPECIES: leucyl aminopeptidase [unclassified Gilliamella]|uniref:leucyl aminopeptidase n=1 Tax=unclassified Gilliamella TaxID=2685620 RepID=UPI0022699758|nr:MULTISPECIES: leucyl aminopeptidase [unclassified Gilliamella]MCX8595744.1 leucyl aminopeptidase [Gilliamella sp. B3493]MCX8599386.1 leucyl aminopeptidase [Gilliamella sp. B3486]MCX8689662.1 leucyl aminopeptidase [Gilliamella sp. B2973]MCX8705375.1 leucyl aminopeptidase [Gilliamella sp. B3127]
MKYSIKNSSLITLQKEECLVVTVQLGKKQTSLIKDIDELTKGMISQLIKSGDINCELGKTTFLYASPNSPKILVVGCGQEKNFDINAAKKMIQAATKELITKQVKNISWDILTLNPAISGEIAKQLPQITSELTYSFDQFKSTKSEKPSLQKVTLLYSDKKTIKHVESQLLQGQIIANAIVSTKNIANMPSNIGNAKYLAEQGKSLGKQHSSLKVTCLGEKELAKLNMNAYLAVGRGSANESIMTVIEYHGAKDKKAKPYVLVGKGLTFDSGGISIKPSAGMDEMKYDMCGAATVFGVMQAVAELKLPINVVGVMAGCENMPDGNSYRPGDILTTMSGTTVEIINTDAEGRLVLCDALTYVERFQPKTVIDIATLTGACIIALGHHYTGVMGNNAELTEQLVNSSNQAGDKAWSLPIDSDFQEQIKSTCADIVNAGGRDGGTITAACFLSRFTEKYQWAHLDIAGTAWKSGANKGATGRPVAMLIQYLLNQK